MPCLPCHETALLFVHLKSQKFQFAYYERKFYRRQIRLSGSNHLTQKRFHAILVLLRVLLFCRLRLTSNRYWIGEISTSGQREYAHYQRKIECFGFLHENSLCYLQQYYCEYGNALVQTVER